MMRDDRIFVFNDYGGWFDSDGTNHYVVLLDKMNADHKYAKKLHDWFLKVTGIVFLVMSIIYAIAHSH